MKKTLYGVDKSGGVKQWSVWTEGDTILVEHGKRGGEMQVKRTVCKPKNVGRSSETSSEQQAINEAQSKYNKQIDKFYRVSEEEARSIIDEGVMLAQDMTKHPKYLNWSKGRVWVFPKLDGLRVKTVFDGDGEPSWTSRGGKPYSIPDKIKEELKAIHKATGYTMLDGEAYIHGEKLQSIQSATKKHNELTDSIEYHIFDVPDLHKVWEDRSEDVDTIGDLCESLTKVEIVRGNVAFSFKDIDDMLGLWLEKGYEGVMVRNPDGPYLFQNKRSNDLLKYKKFFDSECKVVGCEEDKNGEGKLMCLWKGVHFELKMKGNHSYRCYESQLKLVGKWINFKYQDLTLRGVPTFAVGTGERDCDEDGNPNE